MKVLVNMSKKTVFISYRRDNEGKSVARSFEQALTHRGYDVFLDVDNLEAGYWADQILTQIPRRAHFLLLLTPGALKRCADKNDWVRREFLCARQHGRNIVPVRWEDIDIENLRKVTDASVQPVFDLLIAEVRHSAFEQGINTLVSPLFIHPSKAPAEYTSSSPTVRVDISRIAKYDPAKFIGRETETKLLTDAWDQAVRKESERPRILTFVALGGEGKTSLVAKWAADLAHKGWPGCEAVFWRSFYSQGTMEQTEASSDKYIKEALYFFGDPQMADGAQYAGDKGKRLAQLVGEKRTLLILDGVEPLQYAPPQGKLRDAGIAALLTGLAAFNNGLCVVTTRYSIPDLNNYRGTTAPEIMLQGLPLEDGVQLLKSLKVNGAQNEFESLVNDVNGHALTLNLLGTYIRDAHTGDIRKRDTVKLEEADAEEQGGHAFRVMDAYVRWFENGGENEDESRKGRRALSILRLLGLFDRPANVGCIEALLNEPVIQDLTEMLAGMSEEQRNLTYTRLVDARLLTVIRDSDGKLVALDAHPLIREYFAKHLRTQHADAWRTAHRRLFEHLCKNTKEGAQPTLNELQPLYQAVVHGCLAGIPKAACTKVFFDRILRGDEGYSMNKLGAIEPDLKAISRFFMRQWSQFQPELMDDNDQGRLLNEAAFRLRALGQIKKAQEIGAEALNKLGRSIQAVMVTGNLSELKLTLGEVDEAIEVANQSVKDSDTKGHNRLSKAMRGIHADALHQAGKKEEANTRFIEGKNIQAEQPPSLFEFQYCDLLLALPECVAWRKFLELSASESEIEGILSKVSKRAESVLKNAGKSKPDLLAAALDNLTLGRVALYREIIFNKPLYLCHPLLQAAVEGIRCAGRSDFLPRSLLTRAWQHTLEGRLAGADSAQADLDEAWEIAERGSMPLISVDIHLHRARLFKCESYPSSWGSPQADLAAARQLITQHGYLRRMEELEDAEK